MGLERLAPHPDRSLPEIVAALAAAGVTAILVMIDNAFVVPGRPLPEAWRDARVKTPAGTVTLARRPDGIAVVVFGNADEPLRAAQDAILRALGG
jgi:hypothetical protein